MNREELEKLVEKYDRQAEKNSYNYQDTGLTRYDTARRNAEDLADALRMALNAEDDHSKLLSFKGDICIWASRAQTIQHLIGHKKAESMDSLLRDILATARMNGLCREE